LNLWGTLYTDENFGTLQPEGQTDRWTEGPAYNTISTISRSKQHGLLTQHKDHVVYKSLR